VNQAAELIRQTAAADANIIFGAVIDERLKDQIQMTVIATGFELDHRARVTLPSDRAEETPAPGKRTDVFQRPFDNSDLDIPAFLRAGLKATPAMRRVSFTLRERLAVVPVELAGRFLPAAGLALLFASLSGLSRGGYLFDPRHALWAAAPGSSKALSEDSATGLSSVSTPGTGRS
jgi:hypothetical protein